MDSPLKKIKQWYRKMRYFIKVRYGNLMKIEVKNGDIVIARTGATTGCNKIDLLHRQNKTLEAMAETLLINQNQTQIRTLEKLRDTLLPKLMSGEVRVKLEQREAVV